MSNNHTPEMSSANAVFDFQERLLLANTWEGKADKVIENTKARLNRTGHMAPRDEETILKMTGESLLVKRAINRQQFHDRRATLLGIAALVEQNEVIIELLTRIAEKE